MTDVLIKRELLERVAKPVLFRSNEDAHADACAELRAILAAPRQPEGDGLEVVGYRVSVPDEPELGTWLDESAENEPHMCLHEPLCRLSDAQRAIAELREECERLRGPEGTVTSARGDKLFTFMSKDPCRYQLCEVTYAAPVRVLISERDTLRQQRDKLAGLLRECRGMVAHEVERWTRSAAILPVNANVESGLLTRIDAALAEVKP